MSKQPTTIRVPSSPPDPKDDALVQWYDEQRFKSTDHLEGAAKQLITLCTSLLTALLGLLALAGESLPKHMQWSGIQFLGGAGIVLLFVSLATALIVLYPRHYDPLNAANKMLEDFKRMMRFKSNFLLASGIAFGLAMFCIAAIVIGSLVAVY